MEFEITRTSDYLDKNKPCDKAYLAGEDEWGNIYKIKIDTLEDLISLMEEVGEKLILKQDLSIEIYDDWRE